MRLPARVVAPLFAALAGGCTLAPIDPAGRACDDKHVCAGGFLCVDGACELACPAAGCPDGRACVEGACLAVVFADAGFVDAGFVDGGSPRDGGTESDAGFVVDGGPPDHAPVVAPPEGAPATTHDHTPVDVPLSASDADGNTVTFVVTTQPAHGSAVGTSTGITYTPEPGFAGFDSAAVAATDGQLTGASVDVIVYTVGRSCAHILTVGGSVGNGDYLIDENAAGDIPDAGPVDVLAACDMTTAGGGWSLALRADGTKDTFCFDNALWTDPNTVLNPDAIDEPTTEAKLAPYDHVAAGELLVSMHDVAGGGTQSLVVPLSDGTGSRPLADVITDGVFVDSALRPAQWAALFPARASDLQFASVEGLDVSLSAIHEARIGAVGPGNGFTFGVGVGLRTAACGGSLHTTAGAEPQSGCCATSTIPALASVFVRSRDFTFLPAVASCGADQGRALTGVYKVDSGGGGGVPPKNAFCNFEGGFLNLTSFDGALDNGCPGDPGALVRVSGGCARNPALVPAGGAVSLFFDAPLAYSEVRVSVTARPSGNLEGFAPSVVPGASLDSVYVDGISVTTTATADAGSPRQHVFTFAVGRSGFCPCDTSGTPTAAPPFVDTNYACDGSDPLFDLTAFDAACNSNTPIVADVTAAAPSTGPVEVRIMTDQSQSDEDIILEKLEVSVR